jgi:hypothetical protein
MIFYDKNFDDFIDLYKQDKNLYLEIWEIWYINFFYELKYKWIQLPKYSERKINKIIENFKQIFESQKNFWWKIIYIWSSYWKEILEEISENPEQNYKKLKNILLFNKTDKQYLEKEKKQLLETKHRQNHITIKNLKNYDFSLLWLIDFDDNIDYEKNLKNLKILENQILLQNHYFNDFIVIFTNIAWEKRTINLTWNKKANSDKQEIYTDKQEFFTKIKEIKEIYSDNLEINNIDYSIMFFKSNWWKKKPPASNNIYYNPKKMVA